MIDKLHVFYARDNIMQTHQLSLETHESKWKRSKKLRIDERGRRVVQPMGFRKLPILRCQKLNIAKSV